MRFGFKCPLILAATAAAVIYGFTGFSFVAGDDLSMPDVFAVASGAENGTAAEIIAVAQDACEALAEEASETDRKLSGDDIIIDAAPSEETADIAEETADTAEETADIAEETADTAEETADTAEDTADTAEETADIAEETADIAEETADTAEETAEAETGETVDKEDGPGETADKEEGFEERADTAVIPEEETSLPPVQKAAVTDEKPWERSVVHTATDTVEADYFADALFIGDSRTVGLSQYCPELDEQAEFYSKVSLTVKGALDKPFVKTEDGRKTVDEMLSDGRQFGKIYIMLGINEIGGGSDESFADDYSAMIDRIREKQPNAMIFIQSIMHVTKRKSDSDRHINNPRIDSRNAAIARLADAEKGIYYVDINQAVDDGEGNLTADLSFDEVHLKAVSYGLWYDFLKTHAHI
ncbi:MAG: hypothetical protein K6C95_10250 [Lachnospiraceae bacterium]|nr:hypothetical protein [Lachnospiraceae bacterium]